MWDSGDLDVSDTVSGVNGIYTGVGHIFSWTIDAGTFVAGTPGEALNIQLMRTGNKAVYLDDVTLDVLSGPSVQLSNNSAASNVPGTLVGSLSMLGVSTPSASHSFTFVAGAGDTDNGKFDLVNGNELRSSQFLPSGSYDIRIEADDGGAPATTVESTFAITSPVATYSAFVASAGVTAGTPAGGEGVASLEAYDSDGSSIATFGIVGGRDDLFQIGGNELQQKAGADPGAPSTIHYVTLFADGAVDDFVIVAIEVGSPPGTVIRIR